MRGLGYKESDEFLKFFAIVQEEAKQKGCIFFLYSGEGRDIPVPGLEGMDLSGWLVPEAVADEFEQDWEKDLRLSHTHRWDDFETIAVWKIVDGAVRIEFQ